MITCKLVLKMHAVQKREKAKQDYFSSLKFQNKLRPPFEENLMNPMALLFFISFFSSFFVLFFYQNNVQLQTLGTVLPSMKIMDFVC